MKAPLFSKDVVFKNNTYQDPQLDKFYSILRQYWAEAEGFEPEPSEARNPDDDDDDGIDDGYESPPHSDSESEEEAEAAEPQVENTQEPVTQPMPEVSEGGKGENPALAAMGPTGVIRMKWPKHPQLKQSKSLLFLLPPLSILCHRPQFQRRGYLIPFRRGA